jgi:hypothetical protein
MDAGKRRSGDIMKRILCTGYMEPAATTLIVTLPVSLTPEAFIAYLKELFSPSFEMVVQPDSNDMDELEFMAYTLELHRANYTPPVTHNSKPSIETTIEAEHDMDEQIRFGWMN